MPEVGYPSVSPPSADPSGVGVSNLTIDQFVNLVAVEIIRRGIDLTDQVLDQITARLVALESDTTTIAEVVGLQPALDALQASATAATDAELASAIATIQAAVDAKQPLSTAATDAELAAAIATVNASMATDTELAGAVATVNTTIAAKQSLSEKGQPNGYAPLDSDSRVPAINLPNVAGGFSATTLADGTIQVSMASNWGITSTGKPYYDSAGASPGEEAWPSLDTDGNLTLTTLAGGMA